MSRRPDVLSRLDPEMLEALAKSEALHAEVADALPADPIAARRQDYEHERRYWNAEPVPIASVEERTVEAAGLPTKLRFYRPEATEDPPAILFLHGGGWVVGNLDTHDRVMRLLALHARTTVIGVDYALAPEAKFPTQIDQAVAVVRHLGRPLVLAGDSAGAHLSLATALDLVGPQSPVRGLLLWYGAYGLSDGASRRLWGGPVDGLGPEDLAFYRDAWLRGPEDRNDPRYDLLARDLAGLPPVWVGACALDPLHDDSATLAGLLAAAQVSVESTTYEGVLHGFLHLSRTVPKAETAIRDGAAFLQRHLRPESGRRS
ncbi:MAG: alpha/beta hydrolase fold domain-containing protein [Geminicoccaceae bacterium]